MIYLLWCLSACSPLLIQLKNPDKRKYQALNLILNADVAELADALDLGSTILMGIYQ